MERYSKTLLDCLLNTNFVQSLHFQQKNAARKALIYQAAATSRHCLFYFSYKLKFNSKNCQPWVDGIFICVWKRAIHGLARKDTGFFETRQTLYNSTNGFSAMQGIFSKLQSPKKWTACKQPVFDQRYIIWDIKKVVVLACNLYARFCFS